MGSKYSLFAGTVVGAMAGVLIGGCVMYKCKGMQKAIESKEKMVMRKVNEARESIADAIEPEKKQSTPAVKANSSTASASKQNSKPNTKQNASK